MGAIVCVLAAGFCFCPQQSALRRVLQISLFTGFESLHPSNASHQPEPGSSEGSYAEQSLSSRRFWKTQPNSFSSKKCLMFQMWGCGSAALCPPFSPVCHLFFPHTPSCTLRNSVSVGFLFVLSSPFSLTVAFNTRTKALFEAQAAVSQRQQEEGMITTMQAQIRSRVMLLSLCL